jgi:DNA polymerase III subunit epsilon
VIHTLLNLTRPLFVLDTETTGLTPDARIVELGFQMWAPEGPCKNCEQQLTALKSGLITEIPPCTYCHETRHVEGGMIKEWRSLVNPGIPIPQAVIDVHGITDVHMTRCQRCSNARNDCICDEFRIVPTFKQLAPSLLRGFTNCDYAGKNVRFDLRILSAEFQRAGHVWSYEGARIVDIDRLEALAIPRNLEALHEKYVGHKHDGAHGALSDVRASATVIVKQLEAHSTLPRDLDALHAAQWPGWLCSDGSFRMVNGVPTVMFGKHRDRAMRDVPNDYYDFILKNSFPADVKRLAAEAKLGRYPEVSAAEAKAADKRMDV